MSAMTNKHHIRRNAIKERLALPEHMRADHSAIITKRVEQLPEYINANTIAVYVSMRDEVQTKELIESALAKGTRVLIPKSDTISKRLTFHEINSLGELARGAFGVLEPPVGSKTVPLSEADIIIVPVVAWDIYGGRLGYGKGYFDQALKSKGDAPVVGLAFESQQREKLPLSPHDVQLDMVVTEVRAIRFNQS